MRDRWQTEKLGNICQFINGLWTGEKPPFVNVGVIRNTNFTKEGRLDYSDIAYLDVEVKKFQTRQLQPGDIILEKSGGGPKQAVGRVVLFDKVNGEYSFSNFTAAIRIMDASVLDAGYLHKYLHWIYLMGRTEAMQSHSTGIRNLDGDAYKGLEVAFPPLPEQHRIVAILDEAFAGIATATANAKKNLANARELFDEYLSFILSSKTEGWNEANLGELATFKNGLNFTKSSQGEIIKIVGVKDFQNKFFVPNDDLETVQIDAKLSSEYELQDGDILTVRSNGNKQLIGRCLLAKDPPPKTSHSGFTIRIRLSSKSIDPRYLVYFLKSKVSREKLIESGDGTNISSLNQKVLTTLEIRAPSLAHQLLIVEKIEEIAAKTQALCLMYQQKSQKLTELKQSILKKAFSGALTGQPDRLLDAAE